MERVFTYILVSWFSQPIAAILFAIATERCHRILEL